MIVKLDELKQALDVVFEHLRAENVTAVEVDEDFYWNIPAEVVYDPLTQPEAMDVGQLTEDWVRIQAIADGTSPPIGFALVWSAAVLRRIGEKNVG